MTHGTQHGSTHDNPNAGHKTGDKFTAFVDGNGMTQNDMAAVIAGLAPYGQVAATIVRPFTDANGAQLQAILGGGIDPSLVTFDAATVRPDVTAAIAAYVAFKAGKHGK